MPSTYEPIATQTLGSAASSITFSSIPSTYTDLKVIVLPRSVDGGTGSDSLILRYNSDTGTNYSNTRIRGNGTAAYSGKNINQTSVYVGEFALAGSPGPSLITIDIFSYSNSTFKTLLASNSADLNDSGNVFAFCGLWRSTAAISTLTLSGVNYQFNTGSTATLYGIKAA